MMNRDDVPVIAIVDDDLSVRRALLRVLDSAGYKGAAFASGREFLAWVPDGEAACLIVLDVHMDEMTGFELQSRLAVPVIFITGHDDRATREGIAKSGCRYLQKPFTAATLVKAIQQALHR